MRINASTRVKSNYLLLQNFARFSHTHSMRKSHLSHLIATDVATRMEKKIIRKNMIYSISKDIKIFLMETRKSLTSGISAYLSITLSAKYLLFSLSKYTCLYLWRL